MIPPLVGLALDYYRNPLAYGHLADGSFPLPRGFAQHFSGLASALSPLHVEATARMLASTPDELEAAARFFARHVLLDPAASHYRCLGASPRTPRRVIREHYLFLIRLFHPDRLRNATETDLACSRRLNAAYHLLYDPRQRADYDRANRGEFQPMVHSDPRDFFGPQQVPLQESAGPSIWRTLPWARRSQLVLFLCVVILASAIYMVWQAQSMRLLSSTLPPAATLETPLPHYLRREAAADPGDAEADAFTTVPRLSRLEERHESNVHDVEWSASPPHPASIGTRITNELQIAFRRGDTARLSELFVQTEQTAHALARQLQPLFAEPLMSEGKRLWLVVTDMDWQYAPEGWIHGRGLAVAASPGPGGTWQEVLHGAVELELIPIASEYRIHSLRFLED